MLEAQPKEMKRRRGPKWPLRLLLLLAAGLLAAGGVAVYLTYPARLLDHAQLVSVGESLVRRQIPPEFNAAFSPAEETSVDSQGGAKYLVQGWVDLIAADGENERQIFSCVIYKTDAGNWVGEQITLLAQ